MNSLDNMKITMITDEILMYLNELLGSIIVECRLFGSCARGDYTEASDIDVALLTSCSRLEIKKFDSIIDNTSADIMLHYNEVLNFICIPIKEFDEKKNWYPFYRNIEKEGKVFYE